VLGEAVESDLHVLQALEDAPVGFDLQIFVRELMGKGFSTFHTFMSDFFCSIQHECHVL
jgi:hypothetical protein